MIPRGEMKTIEVAVELVAQMGEWSDPVRVRYTEDPFPMLEFQTVGGQDDTENGSDAPDEGCCGRPDEPHYHRETLDGIERVEVAEHLGDRE